MTSHRLVTRLTGDSGRLISNWWRAIAGVQIDLERQTLTMDDYRSEWRGLYAGPATPIIAVAAIERIYGPAALLEHPGLVSLRSCWRRSPRNRPDDELKALSTAARRPDHL
jgi:hypothetical protein